MENVFFKFNSLNEKLSNKYDPYGSLIKLGKATAVEKRYLEVYPKGISALRERVEYYSEVLLGEIKYSPEMRTSSTVASRAQKAKETCYKKAEEITMLFDKLVRIEIPQRYGKGVALLFECQEKEASAESAFMKQIYSIIVSSSHTFDTINNSIVSNCEMLGFCICNEYNRPPYLHSCMECD